MTRFRVFLVALVMLWAELAVAQITIHDTDFLPAGGGYTWGQASNVAFSVGGIGANQTWTFDGTYTWESVVQYEFVTPASTPHGADFPAANRARHSIPVVGDDADMYMYEQITPSGFSYLGQAIGDTLTTFTPPWCPMSLPLTYQATWTGVMRSSYMAATVTDSAVSVANGWGTLTTPYGTWPVLKWLSHHYFSVVVNGNAVQQYQYLTCAWVNQQGEAVVALRSPRDVTDPNFGTGYLCMMGVPLASDPQRGAVARSFTVGQNYPNPFNPTTILPIALERAGVVSLDIFDATGRLVTHEARPLAAGENAVGIDGSRWATGVYFTRVTAGNRTNVVKMLLTK